MNIGDFISVKGCVTQEKFIAGRCLPEIEKILGFHAGRLSKGIAVVALTKLPETGQFELAAYSNVATHRHKTPGGLNIPKLKSNAMANWSVTGPNRLVKVLPTQRHDPSLDPDVQYPPGHGAPQWMLTVEIQSKVVALVTDYPNGRYLAADVVRRY